jgi:hypothetical protein
VEENKGFGRSGGNDQAGVYGVTQRAELVARIDDMRGTLVQSTKMLALATLHPVQ